MQDSQLKKRTSYLATVPPQEILPIVNSRSETSVPGIFVIGDVTGLPLVKIAANQGAEVISKLAEEGRFEHTQTALQQLDLVILGAGPAGLAAAVEAQQRGLKYVVLERNKVANTVRSFPPGKMVYAEPRFITNTSGLETNEDLDKDTFLQRIDQLVHEQGLHIKEGTEVTTVQKLGPQRFEVQTKSGKSFPARYVLVAIGRQGQPRLLECPGADRTDKVTYRLHSPDDYQGQEIYDTFHLLKFLMNPDDDIALVGLLRSPFANITDEGLFFLAVESIELSYWQKLHRLYEFAHIPAEDREKLQLFFTNSKRWLGRRDRIGYFELLSEIFS